MALLILERWRAIDHRQDQARKRRRHPRLWQLHREDNRRSSRRRSSSTTFDPQKVMVPALGRAVCQCGPKCILGIMIPVRHDREAARRVGSGSAIIYELSIPERERNGHRSSSAAHHFR